jgi:hypothetical protein
VTWDVPSDRIVVPRSDASRPEPALGVPVYGGQNLAHGPLHMLLPFTSLANSYRVMPFLATRIWPSGDDALATVPPLAAAAAAGVEVTCGADEDPLPPQAAARAGSARMAARTAIRIGRIIVSSS